MLIIRQAQMDAFRESARRSFEAEMTGHLRQFSPPLARALGEDQLREAIRFGIGRAAEYGFTFRGPVRLYLESMLLFGGHFNTDPQYPWAHALLTDETAGSQMERAGMLYAKILDYRTMVTGPDDTYTLRALRRIRDLARGDLAFSAHDIVSGALREIGRVYPEKAAYTDPDALERMVRHGIDIARRHDFVDVRHMILIVVMMLAFGHGCTGDPLYPWIGRTLVDDRIVNPVARADRLTAKALTWLDHVLAYFEGTKA